MQCKLFADFKIILLPPPYFCRFRAALALLLVFELVWREGALLAWHCFWFLIF